jgi:hypothetical protein
MNLNVGKATSSPLVEVACSNLNFYGCEGLYAKMNVISGDAATQGGIVVIQGNLGFGYSSICDVDTWSATNTCDSIQTTGTIGIDFGEGQNFATWLRPDIQDATTPTQPLVLLGSNPGSSAGTINGHFDLDQDTQNHAYTYSIDLVGTDREYVLTP